MVHLCKKVHKVPRRGSSRQREHCRSESARKEARPCRPAMKCSMHFNVLAASADNLLSARLPDDADTPESSLTSFLPRSNRRVIVQMSTFLPYCVLGLTAVPTKRQFDVQSDSTCPQTTDGELEFGRSWSTCPLALLLSLLLLVWLHFRLTRAVTRLHSIHLLPRHTSFGCPLH